MSDLRQRIYHAVCQIPLGYVSTYGGVARHVGTTARQVGYALAALPNGSSVPWQRVINARGQISIHNPWGHHLQRELLTAEGISFDDTNSIDLVRFAWHWQHG